MCITPGNWPNVQINPVTKNPKNPVSPVATPQNSDALKYEYQTPSQSALDVTIQFRGHFSGKLCPKEYRVRIRMQEKKRQKKRRT
jgi:hypothetical protein